MVPVQGVGVIWANTVCSSSANGVVFTFVFGREDQHYSHVSLAVWRTGQCCLVLFHNFTSFCLTATNLYPDLGPCNSTHNVILLWYVQQRVIKAFEHTWPASHLCPHHHTCPALTTLVQRWQLSQVSLTKKMGFNLPCCIVQLNPAESQSVHFMPITCSETTLYPHQEEFPSQHHSSRKEWALLSVEHTASLQT